MEPTPFGERYLQSDHESCVGGMNPESDIGWLADMEPTWQPILTPWKTHGHPWDSSWGTHHIGNPIGQGRMDFKKRRMETRENLSRIQAVNSHLIPFRFLFENVYTKQHFLTLKSE